MHNNTYDKEKDVVVLNEAQMNAWKVVATHYRRMYQETDYRGLWPMDQITKPKDVEDLAAFFFWGGWLCAAARPGEDYSYTHNWPYDPLAGNHPTPEVVMWSLISILVLFVGIGITLYVYGQFKDEVEENEGGDGACNTQSLTTQDLENGVVRPTQRATYKFFVLAMFAFFIQTFAGIACSIDFVRPLGMSVTYFLPFSVWRSYHACFQIYWFFVVWVGSTIFCLPRFSKVPLGQSFLIETLFIGCAVVAVGGLVGIPLGQGGYLQGKMAYWFGSQGWEFMELGRLFQDLLLAGFVMWIVILFRGVYPYITWKKLWSPPAWLFYGSMVMVAFLFFSLNVTPKTNFIVSDFWRWMVVHMWVEVTFEVFTTVVVSFLYTEMGLVSRRHAERATYIAVMLFFPHRHNWRRPQFLLDRESHRRHRPREHLLHDAGLAPHPAHAGCLDHDARARARRM
jgi:nitric oxide reductase subunit B